MELRRNWILAKALRMDYLWRGPGRGSAEQEGGVPPREQSPPRPRLRDPRTQSRGFAQQSAACVVGVTLLPQQKQVVLRDKLGAQRVRPPPWRWLDQLWKARQCPLRPLAAAPHFSAVSLRAAIALLSLTSL